MSILLFFLILVVLILVHEFGHFIVAKAFGIAVHEFGIFFPPRIAAIKKGETEYSINWLPFGGFVKIVGENYDEGKDDPRSFINKSRYQQFAVIIAGVTFNLLFAWLVLSTGYLVGLPTSVDHIGVGTVTNGEPTIVVVIPNSPADRAGLKEGDVVESVVTGHASIDARALNTSAQADAITNFMTSHPDESLVITVARNHQDVTVLTRAEAGFVDGRKVVGVQLDDVGLLRLPPHLALYQGGRLALDITESTALGLANFFKEIVVGKANFSQVSGPIGITVFGAAAVKQGFAAAVVLAALISVNLAVINLLPIPGLDGGRLVVIIAEGIRRKPISEKLMSRLTLIGFALLILLMIVVSYHDVIRLLGPK